eukprot:scaffold20371_cov102-Isochrysis_galbana.AAC.6
MHNSEFAPPFRPSHGTALHSLSRVGTSFTLPSRIHRHRHRAQAARHPSPRLTPPRSLLLGPHSHSQLPPLRAPRPRPAPPLLPRRAEVVRPGHARRPHPRPQAPPARLLAGGADRFLAGTVALSADTAGGLRDGVKASLSAGRGSREAAEARAAAKASRSARARSAMAAPAISCCRS